MDAAGNFSPPPRRAIYLTSARLLTPDTELAEAAVVIEQARITAAGSRAHITPPHDAQRIDAPDCIVVPGLIDLQCNGGFGFDFTAEPTAIWRVAQALPRFGVTAFLPTIVTSPLETIQRAQSVLRAGAPQDFCGASPLGLHLEGPFLNPLKRGAHNPAQLRAPDESAVSAWAPDTGVRLATLAPELDGALAVTRTLTERGVIVSAGHSMATFEQAQSGFDAGITYGTHLFNAMPLLDHRAPGLVAALLKDPRVTVGIIPDGIHVHPALVSLALQVKTPRRLNVVTDAMAALGMPPGEYALADQRVQVGETAARLADGRLAGSILSMDQALRNLLALADCSLKDALATMTTTPARVIRLEHERGRIAPGYFADLVLLTHELNVVATMVEGRWTWHDRARITL